MVTDIKELLPDIIVYAGIGLLVLIGLFYRKGFSEIFRKTPENGTGLVTRKEFEGLMKALEIRIHDIADDAAEARLNAQVASNNMENIAKIIQNSFENLGNRVDTAINKLDSTVERVIGRLDNHEQRISVNEGIASQVDKRVERLEDRK